MAEKNTETGGSLKFIKQSAEHMSFRFCEETISQGIKNGGRVKKDMQFSTWISHLHIHVNTYTHICKHTCMHYTHTDICTDIHTHTQTQDISHIYSKHKATLLIRIHMGGIDV